MQFMLEEYKDVKVGKTLIKQAGQIEIKKTDDDKYRVKVYGMEDIADLVFKTPEETAYFVMTWEIPKKKTKFDDEIKEFAETIKECEYENREIVREENAKNKHISLIKRFKKWLAKKLEKVLKTLTKE